MSAENVEVVRRFESMMVPALQEADELLARAAFRRVTELLDPNVAFRPFSNMPGHGGEWNGHEGFLKLCEAYRRAWELPEGVELEYYDAGGDKVITRSWLRVVSRGTGRSVGIEMVEIVTLRDSKIVDLVPYYYDSMAIIEAGGDWDADKQTSRVTGKLGDGE